MREGARRSPADRGDRRSRRGPRAPPCAREAARDARVGARQAARGRERGAGAGAGGRALLRWRPGRRGPAARRAREPSAGPRGGAGRLRRKPSARGAGGGGNGTTLRAELATSRDLADAERFLEERWNSLRRDGLAEDFVRLEALPSEDRGFLAGAEEERAALELEGVKLDL